MTTAQLILVSVTSALVAVFAMLLVATIRRARIRERPEVSQEGSKSGDSKANTDPERQPDSTA